MPEIPAWLQHPREIPRNSLPCMPMHLRKNYQGRFVGFGAGKVPLSARSPQKLAEGLCGGAAKRCYGKCFLITSLSFSLV